MKLPLCVLFSLVIGLAAARSTSAQTSSGGGPGCPDGSRWSGGGDTVVFNVTDTGTAGKVDVTAIDSSGFSAPVEGNACPGGCSSSPVLTTPGGSKYTISGGRAYRKTANGAWVRMRRVLRRQRVVRGGEEVTSIPWP